jgi:hypothetical protein
VSEKLLEFFLTFGPAIAHDTTARRRAFTS